jgi:DNA-binding MarR family transcriptional regulator
MESADDDEERRRLLGEVVALQSEMETSWMPSIFESLLSIRLTMQQLKVLAILSTETDGSTVQRLSKALDVSLATMSGIVDRLTTQGMASRLEDETDHRVRRVLPTEAGRDVVRRLLSVPSNMGLEAIERLELDDLRALHQGFAAVLRLAREQGS